MNCIIVDDEPVARQRYEVIGGADSTTDIGG